MRSSKDDFLGIPLGTASGRLRKKIMLHLLVKLGENVCHVCGKEITEVSELSIEHIKPWEGRSVELYWDIDNIAFSHLRCNVPHSRSGPPMRKLGQNNTAWCPRCNAYVDRNLFFANISNSSKLSGFCKKHHNLSRGREKC